jgi:hypothetical protein
MTGSGTKGGVGSGVANGAIVSQTKREGSNQASQGRVHLLRRGLLLVEGDFSVARLENDASAIYYDADCGGRINATYTIPDEKTEAITLAVDGNGHGRIDVVFSTFSGAENGTSHSRMTHSQCGGHWRLPFGWNPKAVEVRES